MFFAVLLQASWKAVKDKRIHLAARSCILRHSKSSLVLWEELNGSHTHLGESWGFKFLLLEQHNVAHKKSRKTPPLIQLFSKVLHYKWEFCIASSVILWICIPCLLSFGMHSFFTRTRQSNLPSISRKEQVMQNHVTEGHIHRFATQNLTFSSVINQWLSSINLARQWKVHVDNDLSFMKSFRAETNSTKQVVNSGQNNDRATLLESVINQIWACLPE